MDGRCEEKGAVMEQEYLAVCEVAKLLGCGDKFVYKHKERLPGYVRIAGMIRFHKKTLLDGLKPGKVVKSADNRHGI
jgi:hypothetical protein